MKIMPKHVVRYAIAGSLAIHIVVAHFVRPPSVSAASEPPPEKAAIIHIRPPVKKIVPTPTPPPPHPQHHVVISAPARLPKLAYHTNVKDAPAERHVAIATAPPGGGMNPIGPDTPVEPLPSAAPVTPAPITPATPSCTQPDVAAHVIDAITPETPELARQEGLSGVAEVRVDLGADGNVESVSLYRSSGSTLLDTAALRAAKASRYAAMQHDCKPLSGSYIFRAQFDSQ